MKPKRLLSFFFILVILTFTQTQALAWFYSGNALVAVMREHDRANAGAVGADYTKATEYLTYVCAVYDATEFMYTTPAGLTKGQVAAIVSKYLNNHPEEWSAPAYTLVYKALIEAFPKSK